MVLLFLLLSEFGGYERGAVHDVLLLSGVGVSLGMFLRGWFLLFEGIPSPDYVLGGGGGFLRLGRFYLAGYSTAFTGYTSQDDIRACMWKHTWGPRSSWLLISSISFELGGPELPPAQPYAWSFVLFSCGSREKDRNDQWNLPRGLFGRGSTGSMVSPSRHGGSFIMGLGPTRSRRAGFELNVSVMYKPQPTYTIKYKTHHLDRAICVSRLLSPCRHPGSQS